jgi:Flp pilus assembly pilin Flp
MTLVKTLLRRFESLAADERGLSTVEYVILLALIAVVALGTWQTFGEQVHDSITDSSNQFNSIVLGGGE